MATTAKITSGSTATTLSTEACTSFAPRVFRIPLLRGRTVIQWEENRQGFNTPSWGYMDRTHYYNVIGNIYEDKELLEDEE